MNRSDGTAVVPLEREHVRLGIGRRDEVAGAERADQRLLCERRVLVVVDEQVVEQRRPGCLDGGLGPHDQRGEVDDAIGVEDVEVLAVEPSQLVPPAQTARLRSRLDLLGVICLLGAQQELPDLVGEARGA